MEAAALPAVRGDSVAARRLVWEALDQDIAGRIDSAVALLGAARRADSTDVVAEYLYIEALAHRFDFRRMRAEYRATFGDADARQQLCWSAAVVGILLSIDQPRTIQALARQPDASACSMTVLALRPELHPLPRVERLRLTDRAARRVPRLLQLWVQLAQLYDASREFGRADAACRDGMRAVQHPLPRLQLAMRCADVRYARGDTTGALALVRAARAAAIRDGRPGLFLAFLESAALRPAFSAADGGPALAREQLLTRARQTHDWVREVGALNRFGKEAIDVGTPRAGIPWLSRAIAIADSVRMPDLQTLAYTMRGRAYTKSARLADAVTDLRRAVSFDALAARLYYRADAWHNLAHAYESGARWPAAEHAVGRFVDLTRPMADPIRISALLDAGDIHSKAGANAAARASFAELVRTTTDLGTQWMPAAQFFERTGDLERARVYFRKVLELDPREPTAFAGLARIHERLGLLDSAEANARRHDGLAERWPPLEVPMLPELLARRGRYADASALARAWMARQSGAGNVQGAAVATIQLARLMLAAGRADSALAEAASADSIAATLSLVDERTEAATVRVTALSRLGAQDAAVRVLGEAATMAARRSNTSIVISANTVLGETLSAMGRRAGALTAFDRAARAIDASTRSFGHDLDRAGYHRRHLAPFDDAIELLLRQPDASIQLGPLFAWASRRSATALSLGTNSTPAPGADPIALSEVSRRLRGDEALVQYLVLDSTVAAMVVTAGGAQLVRLPTTAPRLAAAVERLRRPLITTLAGRIDLAHAPVDLQTAAALYAALIQPLHNALAGKRRWFVVPDGALHALAFDALVVALPARATGDAYRQAHYLLDDVEVEYLTSSAFLGLRSGLGVARRTKGRQLLAVSFGAPGSLEEVTSLRDAFPRGRVALLEGAAATERAVKARAPAYGIVHFAVHATADALDPLATHLRLAADTADDGFLHATEIARLGLTADLVVLSACETNVGPIYEGEGVMGLARAFRAGGARRVVATQWPVGGETVPLMQDFYRALARGDPPSTALRHAQLAVRMTAAGAHPFHWAGFLVVR